MNPKGSVGTLGDCCPLYNSVGEHIPPSLSAVESQSVEAALCNRRWQNGWREQTSFVWSVGVLASAALASEERLWRVSRRWRWSRAFCLLYLGSNDGHAGDRGDFNSSNQELSWRKLHERWKCSPKVTAMVGIVPVGLAKVMGVCYVWPIEFPYRNSSPQKEFYFIIYF